MTNNSLRRAGAKPNKRPADTMTAPTASDSMGSLCERLRQQARLPTTMGDAARTMNEAANVLETPKASTLYADRERIARIIDPAAWERHAQILLNLEFENASGQMLQRAAADRIVAPSLAKADAILASPNPSRGEDDRRRILEEALRPFARVADFYDSDSEPDDFNLAADIGHVHVTAVLTLGLYRAARNALLLAGKMKPPTGMKPWTGGPLPPADYDGGEVRWRNGMLVNGVGQRWFHAADAEHRDGQWSKDFDIVEYTPRAKSLREVMAAAEPLAWPGGDAERDAWYTENDGGKADAILASPNASNGVSEGWREQLRAEIINTPETADFMAGVPLEAAHQRERWGVDHDGGKTPFDWFWLIGYLAQKAASAQVAGDHEKAMHHTISTAAALANWHAQIAGRTDMRPGIGPGNGGDQPGAAFEMASALTDQKAGS